ncbi:MAG: 30S ribosome-binding factor RbfA [FCB group bacterium]|nr:30S ribosome-binding factor RbfA [FCB group bacterium]
MESRRVRRINELVKKAIGDILEEGRLKRSYPGLITISNVSVSPDLSVGHVNFTVIGGDDDSAFEYLKRSRHQITSQLAKKVKLRSLPRLQFHPDEVQKHANRIEQLIREIHHNE